MLTSRVAYKNTSSTKLEMAQRFTAEQVLNAHFKNMYEMAKMSQMLKVLGNEL